MRLLCQAGCSRARGGAEVPAVGGAAGGEPLGLLTGNPLRTSSSERHGS